MAILVLATASIAVVVVQRGQLLSNLDGSLSARADELAGRLAQEAGSSLPNTDAEDRFAQLLSPDGAVVAETENLTGVVLADQHRLGDHFRTAGDLPLEDDTYRVLTRGLDDGSILIVGENIDDQRDATRSLAVTLAVIVPIASALLAAITWGLVGRTLRPVEMIRAEVAVLGHRELDRRVPVPATDDEVARLASTMNRMLDRLEDSALRQQRFVADVSHELRSPVTRVRTMLEVELASALPDLAAAAVSALEDTLELQQIIDDLLFLARADAGEISLHRELVDLDDVVGQEVGRARSTVDLDISMTDVSAAPVNGNLAGLVRLVRNLIDNAVRHAAGRVHIALAADDDNATLIVDDDGPGIPFQHRERVVERFFRVDEARSVDEGGTGLGLAIVDEVVRAHRGELRVEEAALGGARFVVCLPLDAGAGPQIAEP